MIGGIVLRGRIAKRALVVAGMLASIVLLGLIYFWAGTSNTLTRVNYQLVVDDPGSGIATVHMQVRPSRGIALDLFLRDTVLDGDIRISDLQVSRNGSPLPHHSLFPGSSDFLRIWLGGSSAPLEVSYRINPTWSKGDVPRSYLGERFGYLRGMVTFYSPYTLADLTAMLQRRELPGNHAGTAQLTAELPAEWDYVLPWANGSEFPTADLRNVYLPVGQFTRQTSSIGDSQFMLAQNTDVSPDVRASFAELLPALFERAQACVGIAPFSFADHFVVSIFPEEPIHGGAAGINSLISSPEPETLAHEIFHWWNGRTLQFSGDADWVNEGFTSYYAGKLLRQVGYWGDGDWAEYMTRRRQAIDKIAPNGTLNLVEASKQLAKGGSSRDSAVVYHGGALVGAWLDRELVDQGRSLDEVWLPLSKLGRQITTTDFLSVLRDLAGNTLSSECSDVVNGLAPIR